jgi:hypothetical protein
MPTGKLNVKTPDVTVLALVVVAGAAGGGVDEFEFED